MTLLEKLSNNKGTVSSALGKEIANTILSGNLALLEDAIPLVCYELRNKKVKHIRSGAAKIVECVAEKRPELITPYLEKLLPSLEVEEPQTKWMVFMTFGYCAEMNPKIAEKALPFAKKYILEKTDGQLCLVGAIDKYLGCFGKTSKENAQKAYELLLESTDNVIMNEHDWIMEGFFDIVEYLDDSKKKIIVEFANDYKEFPRKTTRSRVEQLISKCK
ncbi:MAG: hypothetical protein V1715_02295 [bacterium]